MPQASSSLFFSLRDSLNLLTAKFPMDTPLANLLKFGYVNLKDDTVTIPPI